VLEQWGLGDTSDGLDRFADIALEAAVGTVGLIKPQSAFYERHGWRGIKTLDRLVSDAREAGLMVILDAKRGDVGSTNDAYAEAYLGPGAPIAVDALTVHPYLGLAAMRSFVERAHTAGSCVLVVTRSSNPEGRVVQSAGGPEGSIEAGLLEEIGALNASFAPGSIGPVGAVIGPTHMQPVLELRSPNAIFLAPGIGAQGAGPDDVAAVFAECPDRVIPSASRSLLAGGPDVGRLRETAAELAAVFKDRLV
jgi:orotidine-5'-phosphate decarboxylase